MPNFCLVFFREIRDQLRDRRTLFTIVVLPMLLYPLMGMTFMQIAQFKRDHTSRIWIIGADSLPEQPALLVEDRFAPGLATPQDQKLMQVLTHLPAERNEAAARHAIQTGICDAAIIVPNNFAEKLAKSRETQDGRIPQPVLVADTTSERSRLALVRAERVLNQWREKLVERNLESQNVSPALVKPFALKGVDIATAQRKKTFGWSKILPFVAFLWALTGAFYPAIDMCAGEKERGTLETLLVSPASRLDIVFGKLLAVMTFSLGTCLLNLVGFAATGLFVLPQLQAGGVSLFSAPPWGTLGWLILALIPISALFSAIALALAAFARSSKEGQYYLMPVLFVCLPLMTFALLPGVSLSAGTSVIPLTGVILWLRAVLEGRFAEVVWYLIPVTSVTLLACWIAIRWAVHQFHSESVLFSEGSQWKSRPSLKKMWQRRGNLPTWSHALGFGIALLIIRFFAGSFVSVPESWSGFAWTQVGSLALTIGLPAVVAAFFFSRRPAATLLIDRLPIAKFVVAVLLAVAIHPLGILIASFVTFVLPMPVGMEAQLQGMQTLLSSAPLWQILAVLALAPAVCEELAFRGFMLSGFRSRGRVWSAVLASSLFFGLTHGIIQQSISAAIIGLLIGAIAVWTRSLWCTIGFHAAYNSLTFVLAIKGAQWSEHSPWLENLWKTAPGGEFGYSTGFTVGASVVAALLVGVLYTTRARAESASLPASSEIVSTIPTPHINREVLATQ